MIFPKTTSFDYEETKIRGVYIIKPQLHSDGRGAFAETYLEDEYVKAFGSYNWVQENTSSSAKNVLRGLHYQKGRMEQAKLVTVFYGKAQDVIVDLRKDSETYGNVVSFILGYGYNQILIPQGCAHGFLTLNEPTIFNYKCDNYYWAESEGGIHYTDPDLNIDWETSKKPIVSKKDMELPSFKDYTDNLV